MALERDSGWQAFQRGDTEDAIMLLEAACDRDSNDYEARVYLGAAYEKRGRYEDAIAVLTQAVRLQPANAQARYNLAAALEKAGHLPQAQEAFEQAVTLDPNHFKAREALHHLRDRSTLFRAGQHDLPIPTAPASSPFAPSIATAPHYDAPAAFPPAAPNSEVAAPVGWAAPGEVPGFHAPPRSSSSAALPSHGLLNDYAPSPNSPRGPTVPVDPYPTTLPPPNYNDEIDFGKTIQDFGRLLVSPVPFFRGQAGTQGFMSPFLMIGLYIVLAGISGLASSVGRGTLALISAAVALPFSLAFSAAGIVIGYMISALVVHFLGWMFGNRQDFSVSFRACVYADAPRFVLGILASLYLGIFVMPGLGTVLSPAEIDQALGLPPGTRTTYQSGTYTPSFPRTRTASRRRVPGSVVMSSPRPTAPTPAQFGNLFRLLWNKLAGIFAVSMAFSVIGWLWGTVLLAIGIHHMQRISPGAAVGVVLLMYGLVLLLALLLIFGCAGILLALFHAVMQGSGGAVPTGVGR